MNGHQHHQEALSERAKEALAQRDRLHRHYRRAKAAELQQLYSEYPYGPYLKEYAKRVGTLTVEQGPEAFLAFCREAADADWLRDAPERVRFTALSLAAQQIIKIRLAAGMAPFDDPLPTSDDDVFQIIKQVLMGSPN